MMTRNTVEGSEGNIGWRVAESNWQGGHLLSLFVFPFEGPLTTNLFKKNLYPRHRPVAQGTATAANLRPQSWKTMKPMFFRREAVRWQRSTRSTPGSSRWTRSTVRWSGRHGPGRGVGGTPPPMCRIPVRHNNPKDNKRHNKLHLPILPEIADVAGRLGSIDLPNGPIPGVLPTALPVQNTVIFQECVVDTGKLWC